MTSAQTRQETLPAAVAAPPPSADDVYVFPASYAQRRLWFLDQFEPNSPYYNIPTAFRITGPFDLNIFRGVMQAIADRHESLRTTFAVLEGEPVQVVTPSLRLEVNFVDLRAISPEEREEAIKSRTRAEARTPFSLARGPLVRVSVMEADVEDHVVLITLHHIVADGWSIGVLAREISTLYGAFAAGQPSPLPDLPIQYADYAQWQRAWLKDDELERQLSYWKAQLQGAPDVLNLPTDRPRPLIYTNNGATASVTVPREVVSSLFQLGRAENVTPFMILLAAFNVLLSRLSGQDDITVGTPIANRTQTEVEGLIGLFINTLVIRTDLSGDPTFKELLRRTRDVTLGAYSHQDLPFEMLVDALQPNREMSHTPLFQVMFIVQNAPMQTAALPAFRLRQLPVEMGTSTFDLTMTIGESEKGLDVSVEYNTDLFEGATVVRLLHRYVRILGGVVSDPRLRLSQICLLDAGERRMILDVWSGTEAPREDHCAHELIARHAVTAPETVAVIGDEESLTYARLNARANQLARLLCRLGVGPESRVALCLDKSCAMIVGVLGVLKAGGAYIPLDPSHPFERLSWTLEDAAPAVLLVDRRTRALLASFTGPMVCLDDDPAPGSEESAEEPETVSLPDNAAYVVYTSGTTGKPKGTIVSHRSLVNSYAGWEEAYTLRTVARTHLQMAAFAFDVFSGDFVRALCSGGTLVLCPREILLDPPQLYALMKKEQVDIAEFVPAVLRGLIAYLAGTGERLEFMKLLIAGSDIWYSSEYKQFRPYIHPAARLINSFGLTEAAIDTTYFEAADLSLPDERLVPIGRPFPNSRIYILDRSLQAVPAGVVGELFVGGTGLARGYWRRPDLTAERFIPDPYAKSPGGRLYRTGDLARFLPDGNIEFLGRADHQVKVRGFRIELGDIETALGRYPGVKEGVVSAREETPGDVRLVAYVVPRDGQNFSADALRQFLLERLPEYMVPSAVVILDALPLTPNGKVDRKALPSPDWAQTSVSNTAFVPPRTQTEEIIAAIWQEVLSVPRAGAYDNFFLLGGHSLLATQMVSRIRSAFQVELPLRKAFELPTLAALAAAVDEAVRLREGCPVPPVAPAPRTAALPLSYAQQRLWFLEQLEPNSPSYNLPETYRLHGELDVTALQQSVNEVVRRHEILRSCFLSVDGKPALSIIPELAVAVPVVDLSSLPEDRRDRQWRLLVAEAAATPIRLDTAPLFRMQLIRLHVDDHVIALVMHHAISDDWSTGLLLREMGTAYRALLHGDVPELPPLPVQYADYALWQRNWLQGETLQTHLQYWREILRDAPPLLALPTDRPRPYVQSHRGAYLTFLLPDELNGALARFCREESVTPFMVLIGTFALLLSEYSAQEDVTIGTPVANRNRSELEPLIGFFVNTLALRFRLSGRKDFRSFIHDVRETALGGFAHQDIPFEMVVDTVGALRNLDRSPLFQVMFVMQNGARRTQVAFPSGLTIESVEAHSGTAKFDLTLFMVEGQDGWGGALEYNSDLFDRTTVERMCSHYTRLLDAALRSDRCSPVASLAMVGSAEAERLVATWRRLDGRVDPAASVLSLFRSSVHQRPEAPAVADATGTLSYQQLDRRSDLLAAALMRAGVGPESVVGIYLDRTSDVVAAILAIFKAGGCYLPLDKSYPAERLAFMIADSGATTLISHRGLLADRPLTLPGSIRLLFVDNDIPPVEQMTHPQDLPDALAYIIYTSGSTGTPKGVMVTQRGLSNYLAWCRDAYPLHEGQGAPVHSSLSFDLTLTSLFTPLVSGGTVTMLPEGIDALGNALAAAATSYSVVKITPAHLEVLARQLPAADIQGRTAAFIIGGEMLTFESLHFWQQHAPRTRLFNEYGPTETVVGCCVYEVPGDGAGIAGPVPIGKPIPETALYVLDGLMRPVPHGVPGELCIGGTGVARGYRGRPDLTAERFVPDPFAGLPGARMYRTGDLVRALRGDELVYLGRTDEQLKIRGFRIEPGEIEETIKEVPGVKEAAAIMREDNPGDRRLVAYAAPNDGAFNEASIMAHLRKRLPAYMVPSSLVLLDRLPLTSNGKLDRRALPAPEQHDMGPAAAYVPPSTYEEEMVAGVWEEVLGRGHVGVQESFFDLGGHSLLATQAVARVGKIFALDIPLRTIFEQPTVAGFVREVVALRDAAAGVVSPAISPFARDVEPLLLSYAQQRLWIIDRITPGSAAYSVVAAVRLTGEFDAQALEESVRLLTRRHEILRTVFVPSRNGLPVLRIVDNPPSVVTLCDFSGENAAEAEAEARRHMAEEASRPFDIAEGPLMRMTLYRIAPEEWSILLTMHHIITDDWSTGIFMRELGFFYDALTGGRPPVLPPLRIQYADYAQWERQWLQGENLDRQVGYWKQQLADLPPLELPTDRTRPGNPMWPGGMITSEMPDELASALRSLARSEDCTLYMVLLAGFAALLHRFSGSDDFAVGTPIAHRNRAEIEDLIGFFVNTLVIRSRFTVSLTFRNLIGQTRETTLQAYAHQDVPFELVVDALHPGRNTARSPLFQVMFVFQNRPQRRGAFSSLKMTPVSLESGAARFDLTLTVMEEGGRLACALEYSKELFDADTVERLLRRYQHVLRQLVHAPDRRINEITLLLPGEEKCLREWGDGGRAEGVPLSVIHCFEQAAARHPQACALDGPAGAVTYGALNARANRLARLLQRQGVGGEQVVGVSCASPLAQVTALLAVLKAGGVYLPLDPAYPWERLRYMLRDANAVLLLAQGDSWQQQEAKTLPGVLDLGQLEETLQQDYETTNLPLVPEPESLAYIIYTSGSTGQPKGVMVHQRGIANLVVEQIRAFHVTPSARVLQFASYSFDASVSEIFMALACGATLVVESRERIADLSQLESFVNGHRVTVATFPPVVLALLRPECLPSLRTVISAGERLPVSLARQWREGGRRFFNAYGPTETTIGPTLWPVVGELPQMASEVPIGRPIGQMRAYILDEEGQLVPPGVFGELYIGGTGVGRGYLGRPDLTAERFLPDPFSGLPGARMYRSGDRARMLPGSGAIVYGGRVDQQVKIRGFRIELGEIEENLTRNEGIRDAAVVAVPAPDGVHRLIAHIVPRSDPAPTTAALRQFLLERLPQYMVPSGFVVHVELPRTPNGKVDKRVLAAYASVKTETEDSFVPPRTPEEEILAQIWSQLLQLEQVGAHDNFFDLGGNSLSAAQLVARVRSALGVDIPLRWIFEYPTIAGLAAQLGRAGGDAVEPSAHPIPRVARDEGVPLSFAQQRLWFLDQLEPGSPFYNIPMAARLTGTLDRNALSYALSEVVRRHEVLRTAFLTVDGSPRQVIVEATALLLPVIDASGWTETELTARVAEEARRPFDLSKPPLLRCTLLRLGASDHVIVLTVHHIVSDGWSMGIMMHEIATLYDAKVQGDEPRLEQLPLQYADYAAWQRSWLRGDVLEAELGYWKEKLRGLPPSLALPVDRPRSEMQTAEGDTVTFTMTSDLARAVFALSQREEVTPFMVLLSIFAVQLARVSTQSDFAIGIPVASRKRAEVERLIGFFVNTLVLRIDLSGDPSFQTVVRRVRDVTLEALGHQDVPFEMVVDAVGVERSMSHSPLFQAMFALQNAPLRARQLTGVTLAPLEAHSHTAKFDLTLEMSIRPDGMIGSFEYRTDLFDRSTIEALSSEFVRLVELLPVNADRSLTELGVGGGLTPGGATGAALSSVQEPKRDRQDAEFVAPRTDAERMLSAIWKDVLGVDRVGVNDNFFDLGGDSILTIRVIARARQSGLKLTARDFFVHKTLEKLAIAALPEAAPVAQDPATGTAPLTPIQRSFFAHNTRNPNHFNMTVMFEVPPLDRNLLHRAVRHLVAHHDALRLRCVSSSGEMHLVVDASAYADPFEYIDLSTLKPKKQRQALEQRAAALQRSFTLETGPLIRIAYFNCGSSPCRLLLVMHHLVTDVVSLQILVQDFLMLYQQLEEGRETALPAKSTSYLTWAHRINEYAHGSAVREELAYWETLLAAVGEEIPVDVKDGKNTYESSSHVTLSLDRFETENLLRKVPAILEVQLVDILMTALARAFEKWTGKRHLLVETMGHGRTEIFEDIDLSRTVGWFTSAYPLLLDIQGARSIGDEINAVRRARESVPRGGIGFHLLLHAHPDAQVRSTMALLPHPTVSFNYLGQMEAGGSGNVPVRIARESTGPEQEPLELRGAMLHLVIVVAGGCMNVRWLYSRELHARSTILRLARNYITELRTIMKFALSQH